MQGPSASQTTDAAALLAAGGGGGAAAPPNAVALQSAMLLAEVLRELHPVVLAGWATQAQSIATAATVFSIASDALPKPGTTALHRQCTSCARRAMHLKLSFFLPDIRPLQ